MDESISFFGIDWGVDIFLASKGKINLTDKGYSFFYDGGASTLPNHHKLVKRHFLEYLIPLYKMGAYVISLTNDLSLIKRARIILILLRLNFKVIYGRIRAQVKFLFIHLHLIQDKRYIK